MIWDLKDLIEHCNTVHAKTSDGWVPARPENWKYRSLLQRIMEAYAVFRGKAEAFRWPEDEVKR